MARINVGNFLALRISSRRDSKERGRTKHRAAPNDAEDAKKVKGAMELLAQEAPEKGVVEDTIALPEPTPSKFSFNPPELASAGSSVIAELQTSR